MDLDMDDFRPRSGFVVLARPDHRAPHCCSILQFHKSKENNNHDLKQVAHFSNPMVPPRWLFSPLGNEELLMLPYIGLHYYANLPSLNGIAFNLRSKTLRTTIPPFTFKNFVVGCALNHGGSLYFMPHPRDQRSISPDRMSPDRLSSDNRFERFVPALNKLETLQPFPHPSNTIIQATAVLVDTILFNMAGSEIWVYNVKQDKWYPVTVKDGDKQCYSIEGEAVVRGNTIYALKHNLQGSVLALSIQSKEINREITYSCSLLCEISVPAMKRISSMYRGATLETRSLVHLGKGDFCLVQSCECSYVYQPILLTYMTLKENNSMIVTRECLTKVPIRDEGPFHVAFCFSLPEFKTPPTSQQDQKFFDINPFPEGFDTEYYCKNMGLVNPSAKVQDYVSSETSIFDGQDLSCLDPAVRELLSLYPALKAELSHHPALEAYFATASRNRSHGYAKPPFAPKESTLGDGCPESKRLKTAGEGLPPRSSVSVFELGGGSKTRDPIADTSTPEICKHAKSFPSEGSLVYNGRPWRSYTFPERIIIGRSYTMSDSRPSQATRS